MTRWKPSGNPTSKAKCRSGVHSDLEICHFPFLGNSKAGSTLAQIERRFQYLKSNLYVNYGEFIVSWITFWEVHFMFIQNIDFTIFLLFAYFSDTLIHTIISYQRRMKVKRMVLLVCAGRSGTEMQGTHLCVCLDTDKRALDWDWYYHDATIGCYIRQTLRPVFVKTTVRLHIGGRQWRSAKR